MVGRKSSRLLTRAVLYRTSIIVVIPFIKVRQLVALAIEYVVSRPLDAARRPEPARASVARPGLPATAPQPGLSHSAGCISFEGIHHWLRIAVSSDDSVNMICSHVDGS